MIKTMFLGVLPGLEMVFLLHLLVSVTAAENMVPYTPTDLILLDCGEIFSTKSADGRNWDGDANSMFLPSASQAASYSLSASSQDSSITQVPYMTARIFNSTSTYTFPVSSGPKFIRLYFYPADYSDLEVTKSLFSVKANNYTLLNNFSAFLTVSAIQPQVAFFIKEFIVTVQDNQKLNVSFYPSPSSFAFINGIEVVSMPNGLYTRGSDTPIPYVGIHHPFYLENSTALETVYRLNVGGKDIHSTEDTGLYRTWHQDTDYIFGQAFGVIPMSRELSINYTASTPAYTAPELVYSTLRSMGPDPHENLKYNLTWCLSIDSGFNYLVRLHFCEIRMEVTKESQEIFFIFINNQTAEEDADVIHWSGKNSVPVYKDYVMFFPGGSHGKLDLLLALHPLVDENILYRDAILNGIEIFKLNSSDGNLAGPNPELMTVLPPTPTFHHTWSSERKKSKRLVLIVVLIAGAITAIIISLVLANFVYRKKKKTNLFGSFRVKSTNVQGLSLPSDLCRHFSISEIKEATNNFDELFIIGVGGFGNVYKGFIDGGDTAVAIKKLNPGSQQGETEFKTEIEMLSQLRHRCLVSLIGYCNENGEKILVYDYIARGTLRDHLYGTDNPPLPWKRRLEICIGAARGLDYLHSGLKHTIIHRDVKTTNILLNENWEAKVSDFGLSKVGPTTMSKSHVSTVVKGSFGYLDPEYYRRQLLTEKSDVYSFGVVLFEVLCARPAVDRSPRMEDYKQANLAMWAKECYRRGTIYGIIDPYLNGKISSDSLKKFIEVAVSCLSDKGMERPSMSDVVGSLEFALELQEAAGEHTQILVAVPEAQIEDETELGIECPLKSSLTPGHSLIFSVQAWIPTGLVEQQCQCHCQYQAALRMKLLFRAIEKD